MPAVRCFRTYPHPVRVPVPSASLGAAEPSYQPPPMVGTAAGSTALFGSGLRCSTIARPTTAARIAAAPRASARWDSTSPTSVPAGGQQLAERRADEVVEVGREHPVRRGVLAQ